MVGYEATANYKVIYVFSVPYEDHAGLLKIGDATVKTSASAAQLPPNCELLNQAAHKRIKQETRTAMTRYELLYTELAVKQVSLDDGTTMPVTFRDKEVNTLLSRSGYPSRKFYDTDRPSEWFPVSLETAKKAICAVKEGRKILTEAEKTEAKETGAGKPNPGLGERFTLRDEQRDAINRTKT